MPGVLNAATRASDIWAVFTKTCFIMLFTCILLSTLSSQCFKVTNIAPAPPSSVPVIMLYPSIAMTLSTPLILATISSTSFRITSVRSMELPGFRFIATINSPLSSEGTKPVGVVINIK